MFGLGSTLSEILEGQLLSEVSSAGQLLVDSAESASFLTATRPLSHLRFCLWPVTSPVPVGDTYDQCVQWVLASNRCSKC